MASADVMAITKWSILVRSARVRLAARLIVEEGLESGQPRPGRGR